MTERIQEFLRNRRNEGQDVEPCLVVDLEVVRDNYQTFAKALPDSRVFYAVKANPAPEVLSLLASMGSCFDCASVGRNRDGAGRGRRPGSDLLWQHDQEGARHRLCLRARRAALCLRQRPPSSRSSPVPRPARVFCRILVRMRRRRMAAVAQVRLRPGNGGGLLACAKRLGLEPYGVSFHVGSQQSKVSQWDRAMAMASTRVPRLRRADINLRWSMSAAAFRPSIAATFHRSCNTPVGHGRDAPAFRQPPARDHHRAGPRHGRRCRRHPHRGRADLPQGDNDERRWVYLDIGKFNGLAETMDKAIRYRIKTPYEGTGNDTGPFVLAGPTCDSADMLYEKSRYGCRST